MAKFDVVKDYDWTSAPRGSGIRKTAPRVWVKSFKIDSNETLNRLKSYLEVAAIQDPKPFYDKLYGSVSSPEDDFNFPYFNDSIRSFSNTFGDTFQNGFGGGGGIGGALDGTIQTGLGIGGQVGAMMGTDAMQAGANAFRDAKSSGASNLDSIFFGADAFSKTKGGSNPGSYIETPKMYQYEMNDSALDVSFVLSNTINSDYSKNTELVKKLTTINRPKRINSIAMEPPRIYQVKIPGQRFIRWAYCSSFSVNMIGAKREIGGVIVPEGYQINMSFTSLTTEVSNFMDDV